MLRSIGRPETTEIFSDHSGALSLVLTPQALADLTGRSVRTLERDRLAGSGVPFVKIGRRILYRRDDVLAFLARRTFTSTAEARRADTS
jgi:hypothetical protein